ncbi:HupE/UreJ family protein [Piscinibacter sp. HJYY11]|uniref:HupE/UreJ family protein n=1 Tax=Piscinibacter sp. HJYY11 TaxID=2801333 RepID=UPI00191D92B7|nr:HupE/UreJ family protein [Piscinibacter sp. HJYY11]MBL0726238.1 HupE/UreJ family protein [Piscinibacter sp. HJYY11]
MRHLLRACVALLLSLCAAAVGAHEISMAEMEVRQAGPTEFLWQWTAGNRPGDAGLRISWPEGCRAEETVLRCGAESLQGRLGVEGVGRRFSAVLVKVYWLDGQMRVHTLTQAQPSVQLFGAADDRRGVGEVVWAYLVLGVEHILMGFDHLLFVLGLLFLVGFERRLVWTITAFTLAHSVTLASSSLGWLVLNSAPVEATIALSIMLVAGEALNKEQTLSRRWPAMVAFLFGLVHGLGFAGALQEIGLPEQHLAAALVTFNAGVELGQLLVVLVACVLWKLLARWPSVQRGRPALLYSMGAVAAYWSIGRIVAILP